MEIKVALDLDGVLRDLVSKIISVYIETHVPPDCSNYDDIDGWKLEDYFPIGKDIYKFMYASPHTHRIFAFAPMHKNVKPFIDYMNENNVDYTLVTCQTDTTAIHSLEWLSNNKLFIKKIQFVPVGCDKINLDYNIYIDDRPSLVEQVNKTKDKYIIKVERPWNRKIDSQYKASNLFEVIANLEKIMNQLKDR